MHGFTHYVEHYIAPHPSHQMRELFVAKTIMDFGTHMMMLFEPLYLHQVVGLSYAQVLLFCAAMYGMYFLALPLGGHICRMKGNERTMLLSAPFLIIWYLALLGAPKNPVFIGIALIAIVIQKILYWPGYHADFAAWSGKGETGREVSSSIVLTGFAQTLAPLIGGLMIAAVGYQWLLVTVCALVLASNIPLLKQPEFYIPQPFSYKDALMRPFQKKNRRGSLAFFGHGEELLGSAAWPLFIALIISDTTTLGGVVSVAMLLNIAVSLYVGRLSDEGDRAGVLKSGAWFTSAAWLLRPLTAGGFGVFLMDSFYRVAKNMSGVPLYAARYDVAREGIEPGTDASGALMESVISYEMALALGKMTAALLGALALAKLSGSDVAMTSSGMVPTAWIAVFGLCGVFSLFYAVMPSGVSMPKLAPETVPEAAPSSDTDTHNAM